MADPDSAHSAELARVHEQHLADMRALVEAGIAITSQRSLEKVLQTIVDAARGVLHARYAALGVIAQGTSRLERFITSGMDEETRQRIGPLPVGKGILGVLLTEAQPLRLRDLTRDPRAAGFPPGHPAMRSFLGVPIMSRGCVYGRLYLTEKQDAEEFGPEDEGLALSLASQAAVAIENAHLFHEVEEQQERLVRAERLYAIGALAATVGHELRNPLSIINNAVYYLNMKVPRDDPRVARNLEIAAREVRTATRIIEDLLDFSRVRPPQPLPVGLGALVSEAMARLEIPEAVRVENRIPAGLPPLRLDPTQVQQVFGNLISNAVEAMPEGGTLSLDAELRENRVVVRVSDSGSGIASENVSRIFEPLFTTKSRGVGLGLALVRRVVEAHQGEIRVESEVGKGTTFILELPAPPAV